MKNQIEKLVKIKDQLQEKHEERENYFWDRSEKWQDSDKGLEYQEKSDMIEYAIGEIDEAIEHLNEFLGA